MNLFVDIQKKLPGFHLQVRFEVTDETMALLGPSGSGKSMTLKCIAGLEKPDSGRIILNGRTLFDSEANINLPPQKRNMGYLFQNYALFPHMTALQNIAAGRPGSSKQDALGLLRTFHLEDKSHHRPHQLSGGEQQRVALARSLMCKPELLLLDEPFSALDSHLKKALYPVLENILISYPALFVSHDLEESRYFCSSVCTLFHGSSHAKVPFSELLLRPKSISQAQISGCQNIFPAKKADETHLFLPHLGVTLPTAHPIPDGTQFACIRAEHILLGLPDGLACRVEKRESNPFYISALLQYNDVSIRADASAVPCKDSSVTVSFPETHLIPLTGDLSYA